MSGASRPRDGPGIDAGEQNVGGDGEHNGCGEGEQNTETVGDHNVEGMGEHNLGIGGERANEIPIGRPHSPSYTEYYSRYNFEWP